MQMFDPSKYVPDLMPLALQGRDLAFKSAASNTQNMSRDFASMNELAAQRQRDKMQLQSAMAQLRERQAARQSLEQRFGQRLGMQQQKMVQDQSNVLYDREQKQRAVDADMIAGLVGPAASGNLNELEAARTAATMRDPSLSVRLPGERGPSTEPAPGIPSVDEVYPEDTGRLRVMRGDQPVYVSPEASEMRRREAAVADLLGPNAGPWSARGVEAAGAGVSGAKAAEIARVEQNKLEGRETAERVAGARMGQQRQMAERKHELESPLQLHDRVRQLAEDLKPERLKIDDQERQFSMVEGQLAEGANPFMQNKALAGIMRAYTGLASTNAERRGDAQSAGMWNYFAKEIDKWTAGAELPPEYREQVMEMVRHARSENQRQIHELGMAARNRVYSSSLPFGSSRDMATYGAQAYTAVTGRQLSADEIEAEARHIEGDFTKRRGGGAQPLTGGVTGDMPPLYDESMVGGSGAAGNLGNTNGGAAPSRNPFSRDAIQRTPPLPVQPQAEDAIDRELEDEALQMLKGE